MELLARLCDYVCLLHFLCARYPPDETSAESDGGKSKSVLGVGDLESKLETVRKIVIFGIIVTTPCDASCTIATISAYDFEQSQFI